ncbi:MAG: hemerythrin family protein [Gammaproteobacteria bacterium]|nr:hemerythrin family protein [Gammaproteobacteria bacterium]
MTLTSLNLKNIPSVGIDFMNRTHQEEIEIVDSLMEKIKARLSGKQNDTEISQQLTHWLEHSQAHFARENELMQETGFPAFPVHSKEHETALNCMRSVIDNWWENKDIEHLQDYVFKRWPNWFLAHVSTMDKVTAEYALMNGYTEK